MRPRSDSAIMPEAGGPDGLVGLLGTLDAVAVAASPLDRVSTAVALADDVLGLVLCGLGQVHRSVRM